MFPRANRSLYLKIKRVEDGTILQTIALLPPDYPDNFTASAEALLAAPPQDFPFAGETAAQVADAMQSAFDTTIGTAVWSPDGRTLAFAGGMDGPSSDVYAVRPESGQIDRMSDGPTEIGNLFWSPDGKWILDTGIYWVGEGWSGTWSALPAAGGPAYYFKVQPALGETPRGMSFLGWGSDTQALFEDSANGRGTFGLSIMNLGLPYAQDGLAVPSKRRGL